MNAVYILSKALVLSGANFFYYICIIMAGHMRSLVGVFAIAILLVTSYDSSYAHVQKSDSTSIYVGDLYVFTVTPVEFMPITIVTHEYGGFDYSDVIVVPFNYEVERLEHGRYECSHMLNKTLRKARLVSAEVHSKFLLSEWSGGGLLKS